MQKFKPRSDSFTWKTKRDLYQHFGEKFDIDQETVDKEIENASEIFKLRKHRPINPQELWEKVGRGLERRLSKIKPTDSDSNEG